MFSDFIKKAVFLLLFLVTAIMCAAGNSTPFQWSSAQSGDELTVSVAVAPSCYLYVDSTKIQALNADGKALKQLAAPASKKHFDTISESNQKIYGTGNHNWRFALPAGNAAKITVDFQGCREGTDGNPALCFMPETLTLTPGTAIDALPETAPTEPKMELPFDVVRTKEGLMNVTEFVAFLKGGEEAAQSQETSSPWGNTGLVMILVFTLLGGLGLNLTPCVLPMIPVNLAILGADGSNWKQGMIRASFYGTGMAAAYGILGIVVILTGAKFGALNSSWIFNTIIAVVFIALALAMFGVYNLDFSQLSSKLDPTKMNWGKSITAFILGVIAALLAGACVAPVVIAVIVFASELYARGNAAGLLLPFVLGIGMAIPWPLAGAGLAVVPRPGMWMERVKLVFGVVILAAAAYYGYLGWSLMPGKYDATAEFARLNSAIVESRESGKPLLIEFGASWCKNCAEMEQNVLPKPAVKAALNDFVTVNFRAEKLSEPRVKALLDALKINGLPAFVIVNNIKATL